MCSTPSSFATRGLGTRLRARRASAAWCADPADRRTVRRRGPCRARVSCSSSMPPGSPSTRRQQCLAARAQGGVVATARHARWPGWCGPASSRRPVRRPGSSSGTKTSSKNTSLNSASPVISRSGRMSRPLFLHVDQEVGQALVLGDVGVGAGEADAPVARRVPSTSTPSGPATSSHRRPWWPWCSGRRGRSRRRARRRAGTRRCRRAVTAGTKPGKLLFAAVRDERGTTQLPMIMSCGLSVGRAQFLGDHELATASAPLPHGAVRCGAV